MDGAAGGTARTGVTGMKMVESEKARTGETARGGEKWKKRKEKDRGRARGGGETEADKGEIEGEGEGCRKRKRECGESRGAWQDE